MFGTGPFRGHRGGMIGALIGGWCWLILLLILGAFQHFIFAILAVVAIAIFLWLFTIASNYPDEYESFADQQRHMGEFVWKACLTEAAFCASLLLLFFSRTGGELLLIGFQSQLTSGGLSTDVISPMLSLAMLWLVCPFMIWIGALVRWVCLSKASISEDDLKLLGKAKN